MKGEIKQGNFEQARERCKHCIALVCGANGEWWCEEGNLPVEQVTRCSEWSHEAEEVKLITAHPDLIHTEQGWGFKPVVKPVPVSTDLVLPIFKFFRPTRECPIHGATEVKHRFVDTKNMICVEGLACGHTILVSRVTRGLRRSYLNYPQGKKHFMANPKNWRFGGWNVVFKTTVQAVQQACDTGLVQISSFLAFIKSIL